MNINRHNYEEFFILYMDNELSSGDRRMVEDFVQLHPDLKEELDLLLQYKLVPDETILFDNKSVLIKGDALINVANYEEWLLLYIDHELSAEQQEAVEQFISANPAVQKELAVLQQSKLQPEPIVFSQKELLYKSEEKVRRLPVGWWRAAAAVLILATGLTTYLVLNNKPAVPEETVATTQGTEENNPSGKSNEAAAKESIAAELGETPAPVVAPEERDPVYQAVTPAEKQATASVATKKVVQPAVLQSAVQPVPVPIKKDQDALTANINRPHNNLPIPDNNPNVINEDAPYTGIASNNTGKETKKTELLTNPVVTTKSPQPSDYTNAAFIEEESQQDGKKNKLRGFFRKITRTFEKRTNIDPTDDDDKLLVAGLAIKLK